MNFLFWKDFKKPQGPSHGDLRGAAGHSSRHDAMTLCSPNKINKQTNKQINK